MQKAVLTQLLYLETDMIKLIFFSKRSIISLKFIYFCWKPATMGGLKNGKVFNPRIGITAVYSYLPSK